MVASFEESHERPPSVGFVSSRRRRRWRLGTLKCPQFPKVPHLHPRAAFPLPGVPLVFRSPRPTPYPETSKILGEHLLKRSVTAGLTQAQVAQGGVNTWTYLLWETSRTRPTVRYWPAVLDFLGYDPSPKPRSLPEEIATKRRHPAD
jgi:hypothetical protein